ncbi:PAS domain-containing sensor histidine kinase [Rhodovibrionaceae bacterium A322]
MFLLAAIALSLLCAFLFALLHQRSERGLLLEIGQQSNQHLSHIAIHELERHLPTLTQVEKGKVPRRPVWSEETLEAIDEVLDPLKSHPPTSLFLIAYQGRVVYAENRDWLGLEVPKPVDKGADQVGPQSQRTYYSSLPFGYGPRVIGTAKQQIVTCQKVEHAETSSQYGLDLELLVISDVSRIAQEIEGTSWALFWGTAGVVFLGVGGVMLVFFRYRQRQDEEVSATAKELRQTALQLAETRSLLEREKDYAEIATDWFWETDKDMRFNRYVNKDPSFQGFPVEKVLGFKREDFVVEPMVGPKWDYYFAQIKKREPFYNVTYTHSTFGGQENQILAISGQPIFDDQGAFAGYRGVGRNVTSLIVENRAFDKKEQRLLAAINSLSQAFSIFDSEDRLVLCNDSFRKLCPDADRIQADGGTFEDMIVSNVGAGLIANAHGQEEDYIRMRLDWHRNPGRTHLLQHRDNIWFVLQEVRTPEGGIISIYTDISELKRIEEARVLSDSRFRAVVESSPSAICIKDGDGNLIFGNRTWHSYHNRDERDIAGVSLFEFLTKSAADRATALDREVVSTGQALEEESETHLRDGRVLFLMNQHFPIFGEGEKVIAVGTISSDLSDHRKAEQAQRAAQVEAEQANRAKSEFLANMSHELRSPLNAIMGFSEVLTSELFGALGNDRYKEYAQDILTSSQHLLALVNDILDLSAVEAGQVALSPVQLDPAHLISDVARFVRDAALRKNITLEFVLPDQPDPMVADVRAMKQILVNLLNNAVKFTPSGGKVSVTVSQEQDRHHFAVMDTGRGMPADKLSQVAQPFIRLDDDPYTSQEGTGLGLAIVKNLLEQLGGGYAIDSEEGVGTTVTFWVPNQVLSDDEEAAEADPVEPPVIH